VRHGQSWGLDTKGFADHYRPLGWLVRHSADGWIAVRLGPGGIVRGRSLFSDALDDLADQIEQRMAEGDEDEE